MKIEAFIRILNAISEGQRKKSHIRKRAGLDWATLKIHLDALVELGLVREVEDKKGSPNYELTSRGDDAIKRSRSLIELLEKR